MFFGEDHTFLWPYICGVGPCMVVGDWMIYVTGEMGEMVGSFIQFSVNTLQMLLYVLESSFCFILFFYLIICIFLDYRKRTEEAVC